MAKAGTTVHVASGTYAETITSSKDGTASAPIRYVSDVDGGAKIKPSGATTAIWRDSGDYVTIQGFDIDGTNSPNVRMGIQMQGGHITVKENQLVVSGKLKEEGDQSRYLHRGIAGRAFERRFQLADYIRVDGARLVNGLLQVDLVREIPEALKPRTIKIETKAGDGKAKAQTIEHKAA